MRDDRRLGGLQAHDVPRVLDEILARRDAASDGLKTSDARPLCGRFWRGRMGLTKEEQLALAADL